MTVCKYLIVPAICLFAVPGCATMSESDCRFADWHGLGLDDARQGRAADYFADRAEACREHGLGADGDAYRAGWQRGLMQFCTVDSGFRHGLDGHDYRDTCPPRDERDFLGGYRLGRDIHEAGARLERLDGRLHSLKEELEELEDRDGEDARRIRGELDDVRDDIRVAERELGRLEAIAVERGFPLGRY